MRVEIHMQPESDEEIELLEQLAEAREYALEEAQLEKESVAAIFAQMAAGISTEGGGPPQRDPRYDCPNCGRGIEDVQAMGLGGEPIADPCGCAVSYEDLPPELYLEDN